jgi:hypothetical protein
MGRGGKTGGNLFGDGEPEDEIPLSDLIPGLSRERGSRSRPVNPMWVRTGGAGGPRRGRGRGTRVPGRAPVFWVVVRSVLVVAALLLGVLLMATGAAEAASGYAAAGRMAAAPACPAGTDLVTDTADCVGNRVMSAQDGFYGDSDEDSLNFEVSADDGYYLWAGYPANAEFDAVIGDDATYPVRVEFWEGNIVALTAARGSDVQTVTTDQNPGNQGGSALGSALLGVGFADLGLLLLIGMRAFRLRWLRPGVGLRLTVSAMIVGMVGVFVAAACMLVQPARVLLTTTIAPSITAGVVLFVWLLVAGNARRAGLRGSASLRRGYR